MPVTLNSEYTRLSTNPMATSIVAGVDTHHRDDGQPLPGVQRLELGRQADLSHGAFGALVRPPATSTSTKAG